MRTCVEEWGTSGGQLSARSIVLLDNCTRTITKRFMLLDGEGRYYFGLFRRLARRILLSVDVKLAYCQTEQEMSAELGWECFLDKPPDDLVFSVEIPVGGG